MDMSEQKFIEEYFNESGQALRAFSTPEYADSILECADLITAALKSERKLMVAGNGGSAADAQHIAGEFISRLFFDHAPLPAIALTTDSSVLTAVGNDYGYQHVFERQVLGLGIAGDVFLGISTSGTSPNVLCAFSAARSRGITTIGFTGSRPGPMDGLCDIQIKAPSTRTAIIQQIHIVAAHMICGLVEARIFGRRTAN
jgi:D-sedoheptulose 7-phosphate isomerase